MSYQSSTIATVIKRLNVQYFLPAIQREFVWKTDQAVQLFDSILRGYPISSFLFWALEDANKDKWEIYSFIQEFDERRRHNPAANAHGVQQLTLVLDGQQRLTSLLIGLRGTYTAKQKGRRWDNPKAFTKEQLYLDLLKDPKESEDGVEIGVRFGVRMVCASSSISRKTQKNITGSQWGASSISTIATASMNFAMPSAISCQTRLPKAR